MWHRPPRSFLYLFCAIVILSTFFLLFDSERRVGDRVPTCLEPSSPIKPPPPPAAEAVDIKDPEPQFCNYCTPTDEICKRYKCVNHLFRPDLSTNAFFLQLAQLGPFSFIRRPKCTSQTRSAQSTLRKADKTWCSRWFSL